MRFFLLLLFLILCNIIISYAQPPDTNITEIPGDTIEGESTDSTIVYIIKKAPVKIKERIEIQRSKLKKHIYYSIGLGVSANSNTYRPHDGKEEYVDRINAATSAKMGYSSFMQLYNAPRKNILGFMIHGKRIHEKFHYTPSDGQPNTFENSYTYGCFGVMVGRWYRKDHRLSFQPICAPSINYKIGVSGYSLNQNNSETIFIEKDIAYHKVHLDFYLTCKLLYKLKNSFIEIAPYANVLPFSMTKKTEAFSITRNIIGISVLLTHKIF